jgi:hypothetical protein
MDDELVSTVRIHHLTREMPYAPTMSVYGDILEPRLAAGESFIDPSRLAIDPDLTALNKALPYIALRPAVMANDYFGTTSCISMIRGEHTAFYNRIFGSEQIGEPRLYPPYTMPIYFYESRCDLNMRRTIRRFPFFASTAMERRLMFARTAKGEPGPLTVLPTAKYLKDAA